MFLERGLVFTHEAVREWEAQLAPLLSETLRKHRRGRMGRSWYVDETFIKVNGRLVYLYRAIDRDGNLVDVLLSEKRDKAAARAFFRSARTVTGRVPERVTSDGHDAYPGAIKAELGEEVRHRTNRYLNTHVEQDHRGLKQRIRPMGASRVWRRPHAFAGRMTKSGTFCVPAHAEMKWYRSHKGDCSIRLAPVSS
jgi:transposase-like protein